MIIAFPCKHFQNLYIESDLHSRICLLLSIKHILLSTRLLIWMHERNTIKLQVQVFLKMNNWMF